MIAQSLLDLWYGFGIALEPHNLMWSFFGVLVGNLIGVLPGMGPISAISTLLPLTYTLHPVAAILMLAGIFYGSQYGGAIGAILLNLPCHPPHAVTCLDGYPMTLQGKGGTALGITMIASFFAASFGILVMIFASPLLVKIAFKFGPAEIFSIMLLGLLAGGTMARGSPLKGVAMTVVGLLVGVVGTDVNTGVMRFTFGVLELSDRVGRGGAGVRDDRGAVRGAGFSRGADPAGLRAGTDGRGEFPPRALALPRQSPGLLPASAQRELHGLVRPPDPGPAVLRAARLSARQGGGRAPDGRLKPAEIPGNESATS